MRVRVLFFGMLKEMVGKSADMIDLPEGATVADILNQYGSQIPRLKAVLPSLALAVNQQYASPGTKLQPDDEVAMLPPVSGGSDSPAREVPARQASAVSARSGSKVRAAIIRDPIDTQQTLAAIKRGEDGAAVVFEGVVRNQTRGRKTLYLDYEAYEEMALQQMESLAAEAFGQFHIE